MVKKFRSIILLSIFLISFLSKAQESNIIFKVKDEYRYKCQKSSIAIPSLNKLIQAEGIQIQKLFPTHAPLKQKSLNEGLVEISSIYRVKANSPEQSWEIIQRLKKDHHIAYAEKEVENFLTYQPNDTANYPKPAATFRDARHFDLYWLLRQRDCIGNQGYIFGARGGGRVSSAKTRSRNVQLVFRHHDI